MYTEFRAVAQSNAIGYYKGWCKPISEFLAACGLVKTADTGQVNGYTWATLPAPPATNNNNFYEIWRFDDPLQATLPVFIKLWYGNSSNPLAGSYCFSVAIGTGSDGAGNLTGTVWTTPGMGCQSGVNTTLYASCLSGGPNRIVFGLFRDLGAQPSGVISIERSHDAAGNDTAEYIFVTCGYAWYSNGIGWQQRVYVPGTGWVPTGWTEGISFLSSINALGSFNGYTPVSPAFPVFGKIGNPSSQLFVARYNDVAEGQQCNVQIYNQIHPVIWGHAWGWWDKGANGFTLGMRAD